MRIDGEALPTLGVYGSLITLADSWVLSSNKLGSGHGEAKLYLGPKTSAYEFFGGPGFRASCFMLREDLLAYMNAIKNEYHNPSQEYREADKLASYWTARVGAINSLDEIIIFTVIDQHQISGPRCYVNSDNPAYELVRALALPLVSYLYIEKVGTESNPQYYWKLLVDFDAIWQRMDVPLVFKYGKGESVPSDDIGSSFDTPEKQQEYKRIRAGQQKYREQLLEQCPYCPITMITEERILIASHIKPYVSSDDQEKVDPHNGYMLSPTYDRLFDRGYMTFTKDRKIVCSELFSPRTWKQLGIADGTFIQMLPMDDKREAYLDFHHSSVFKGSFGS